MLVIYIEIPWNKSVLDDRKLAILYEAPTLGKDETIKIIQSG